MARRFHAAASVAAPARLQGRRASQGPALRQEEGPRGRTRLPMKEKKPEKALSAFQQAVDAGWRPMYITRQHPNHIVRRQGEKEIRIVWLSTTLGKDCIDP